MRTGAIAHFQPQAKRRVPMAMDCCRASALVGPDSALIEHERSCPAVLDLGSEMSADVKRAVEEQAGPYLASRGLRMVGLSQISPRVWLLRWRLR